jgi:hypothetical protein
MSLQLNGKKQSFDEFLAHVQQLVSEGKTSGNNPTPSLIEFTKLNLKRMERIYKTLIIEDSLLERINKLNEPQHWIVITEAWCGDSAQTLPLIGKISQLSPYIQITIISRDENLHLFEKYHTNGANAIPKLIAFNNKGEEIFQWGPRPSEAQQILLNWKKNPQGKSWEDFEIELHSWYAKDRTFSSQKEISLLL